MSDFQETYQHLRKVLGYCITSEAIEKIWGCKSTGASIDRLNKAGLKCIELPCEHKVGGQFKLRYCLWEKEAVDNLAIAERRKASIAANRIKEHKARQLELDLEYNKRPRGCSIKKCIATTIPAVTIPTVSATNTPATDFNMLAQQLLQLQDQVYKTLVFVANNTQTDTPVVYVKSLT